MCKFINKNKQNLLKKLEEDNFKLPSLCRTNMQYVIKRYTLIELLIFTYYMNKLKNENCHRDSLQMNK